MTVGVKALAEPKSRDANMQAFTMLVFQLSQTNVTLRAAGGAAYRGPTVSKLKSEKKRVGKV